MLAAAGGTRRGPGDGPELDFRSAADGRRGRHATEDRHGNETPRPIRRDRGLDALALVRLHSHGGIPSWLYATNDARKLEEVRDDDEDG